MGASVREFRLIVVPYELGRLREGVGCGPERLLAEGAQAALASGGSRVSRELVELDPRFGGSGYGDVDACFELIRLVREHIDRAVRDHVFPVVLSGSCFVAVGVVAGLGPPSPAVAWLDAHSDFNTPETSLEGYFDGMGLAVLTGGAWQAMLASVPGAAPVAETTVVLAGARDLDPAEERRLAASSINRVAADDLRDPSALSRALSATGEASKGVYIHLDLDVLDVSVAPVNVYAAPGGLNADELVRLLDTTLARCDVRAVSLTAYDPALDHGGGIPPIALRVLTAIGRPG
jgi:arginase